MRKQTVKIVLLSALFISLAGVVAYAYKNKAADDLNGDEAREEDYEDEVQEDNVFTKTSDVIRSFSDKLLFTFIEADKRTQRPRTTDNSFKFSDGEFGTFL
jgi:hypothetical protein